VTVAKNIEFADKYENLGAQLVRHVAPKQMMLRRWYNDSDSISTFNIYGRM